MYPHKNHGTHRFSSEMLDTQNFSFKYRDIRQSVFFIIVLFICQFEVFWVFTKNAAEVKIQSFFILFYFFFCWMFLTKLWIKNHSTWNEFDFMKYIKTMHTMNMKYVLFGPILLLYA